jgi:tetratricopeptide (TPR) repeat protein
MSCHTPTLDWLRLRVSELKLQQDTGQPRLENHKGFSDIEKIVSLIKEGADNGSAPAHLALGALYVELGNFTQAEKYLTPGHERGDWGHSRLLIISLTKSGNIDSAEQLVLAAIDEGPLESTNNELYDNVDLILDLAFAFYRAKNYEKAAKWYELYPDDNYGAPDFALIHLHFLERTYRALGRFADADRVQIVAVAEKRAEEDRWRQEEQERANEEHYYYLRELENSQRKQSEECD